MEAQERDCFCVASSVPISRERKQMEPLALGRDWSKGVCQEPSLEATCHSIRPIGLSQSLLLASLTLPGLVYCLGSFRPGLRSYCLSLPENAVHLAEQTVSSEAGSHRASPWPLCLLSILFLLPGIPACLATDLRTAASPTPSFSLSASTNVNSRASCLPIAVYPLTHALSHAAPSYLHMQLVFFSSAQAVLSNTHPQKETLGSALRQAGHSLQHVAMRPKQ